MKKLTVFFVFALMLFAVSSWAQSADEINRELNLDQKHIQDNSERAVLFSKMIEARSQKNETLYYQLLHEYNAKYNTKHEYNAKYNTKNDQVPPRFNDPQDDRSQVTPPFQGDWGSGDIRVHIGNLPLGPANNSQGIFDLEVDSLGNKYVALIQSSKDSIFIYKSIDQGITWTRLNRIFAGGTTKWHSLDFFITDSSGVFRLGIAASRTTTTSSFDGEIYWMTMRDDGTGFRAQLIQPTAPNTGMLNPSIIADGWEFSAGLTYWFVTYQRVNSSTGAGLQCLASYSPNWGYAWNHDTVRSGFNDFNLSMNYMLSSNESLYVAITNDVTVSDPNLRIFRILLGNFGTATGWTQFNVAGTSAPEFDCDLAVDRINDEMGLTYTIGSANTDIVGRYYNPTTYWGTVVNIATQSNNESRARLNCQERQAAYRMVYVSSGSMDSVFYTSSFTMSGLGPKTLVNSSPTSGASTSTSPDIAGFRIGAGTFGGGVVWSLIGPTDLYYDGSNITPTGVNQNNTELPSKYFLGQNYPNPFNPVTNISFSIPQTGLVKLVVFDVMGREVATVVNKNMTAGNYTADFNASSLASGIYFYKISVGDFTDTKKMMLVK
jgi:hypothetical protein